MQALAAIAACELHLHHSLPPVPPQSTNRLPAFLLPCLQEAQPWPGNLWAVLGAAKQAKQPFGRTRH
jgi:hypothetical protein